MIIDFHTHTFPPDIAERTIPMLAKTGNIINYTDGTKPDLELSMKNAGIDYSVLLPIATKPAQTKKINALAAKTNETSDVTGLISFGSIHPENDNYKELLKEAKSLGIKGIKLHPYYQHIKADDEKIVRIVDTIENLDMITIFHAGLDVGFEGENLASPKQFYNLYRQLTPEKLVLAHMGGWRMWNDVEEFLCSLPIYLDISFTLGKIEPYIAGSRSEKDCERISDEQFIRIVKKLGAEHILFGSDSPWSNQKNALELLDNVGLSEEEIVLIKGENARKLLNL